MRRIAELGFTSFSHNLAAVRRQSIHEGLAETIEGTAGCSQPCEPPERTRRRLLAGDHPLHRVVSGASSGDWPRGASLWTSIELLVR